MKEISYDKEELKNLLYDVIYEATKADKQTHSNTLQYINQSLDGLNGHGRIWKYLKTDIGALIVLITFIVSIITPFFLLNTELTLNGQKLDRVIQDVSKVSEIVTLNSGRISKIEGKLELKSVQ